MKPEVKEITKNLDLARAEIDSMCYYLIMAKQGNTTLLDDVVELRERVANLVESVYGKDDVDEKNGYEFEEIFFSIEMIAAKIKQKLGEISVPQETILGY